MNKFFKNILLTFFIGCAVFLTGGVFYDGFRFESFKAFMIDFSFYQLYSFVLGFSNYAYFGYLEKLYWNKGEVAKRIVVGIIGSVLITMAGLFLLNAFRIIVFAGHSWSVFLQNLHWSHYRFGLWITLTIVVVFHFVYFYNRYQQNRLKEHKAIAHTASAQFESLKNQIDPHFLFNSLNVLSSLIDENPENAQKLTVSLAKIYRYVLEQKDKELISVAEELEFAKTYMELLKMRFENSIHFEILEAYKNLEAKVVPLSLQLLLENTVKHNAVSESKPLYITIIVEEEHLVVRNNLQIKEVLHSRKGVGLQNIVNRYYILTNRQVSVDQSGNYFTVKIPILTKQVALVEALYHNSDQEVYFRAKKRVRDIKGFYGNFVSYCVVIPFLIFINFWTYWGYQWFWFPMLGWGLGLVLHAFDVFGYGKKWQERKISELMERDSQFKKWD